MPKIIHYRNKCIGCNICFELQPEIWRMSKKDGKATLIKSLAKKDVFISTINESILYQSQEVAKACPAKIIKII
ncbi:MAG: ferredoxin [Bacteroidota bacterium]|nr:ferredoxin [Bacteroidota bacterium]